MPTPIDPTALADLMRWSMVLFMAFAGIGMVIMIIQTVALLNIGGELKKANDRKQ